MALPLLLGISAGALAADLSAEDQAALSKVLREAAPGQAVELPVFPLRDLPSIPYEKVIVPGPQFLFSDEPEYIRIPEGVAMREVVEPGRVRLYVYNVNGVKEPAEMERRINAVVRNLGDEPLNVRMLRYSSQVPSGNYHFIGKNGLAEFFADTSEQFAFTVAPGASAPLDTEMEERITKYNDLVHGFYEFLVDQPAEISVVQCPPTESSADANDRMKEVIPINQQRNAGRGKFGVSNYHVRTLADQPIDTSAGIAEIVVADNVQDPWVRGIEGQSGNIIELKGNYGVLYDIHAKYTSTDGRGLALVTWNSRFEASQWCGGLAASVLLGQGDESQEVVVLPSNQLVMRRPPEVAVIGVFPPTTPGETNSIHLTYSPPGASCLPMPLIFVPIDWKKE
jgi:hypothetical protein